MQQHCGSRDMVSPRQEWLWQWQDPSLLFKAESLLGCSRLLGGGQGGLGLKPLLRSSRCGAVKQIQLVSMRMRVPSLALLTGWGIWHCSQLWHRPAAAAPIQPVAWELPYAVRKDFCFSFLKKTKKKKNYSHKRGKQWGGFRSLGLADTKACI